MNIGYCRLSSPNNRRTWSGTDYYIVKALLKYCGNVIVLNPADKKYTIIGKIISKFYKIIFKKNFLYINTNYNLKKIARVLQNQILTHNPDLLFLTAGSQLLSFLNTELPVIYLSDTTFQAMVDYYPDHTNLLYKSKIMGNFAEAEAIRKATRIIYASDWAAKSAMDDYGCEKEKISVIPFGANMNLIPSKKIIIQSRQKKQRKIKLLFIGVDWNRKRGKIAFDTMKELNRRGIKTDLTIIGCRPNLNFKNKNVRVIGFLDKNIAEDEIKLHNILLDSSFLIFPTRNECAGIVSCEASAYGLPIIATDTGGVGSYVKNGINGRLLSVNADYLEYADVIFRIWSNKKNYKNLCISARDEYEKNLNWDIWGKKVSAIINDTLNKR